MPISRPLKVETQFFGGFCLSHLGTLLSQIWTILVMWWCKVTWFRQKEAGKVRHLPFVASGIPVSWDVASSFILSLSFSAYSERTYQNKIVEIFSKWSIRKLVTARWAGWKNTYFQILCLGLNSYNWLHTKISRLKGRASW